MQLIFPKFSNIQLERLSEITGNLSLLFLGTIVVPMLTGEKRVGILQMTFGFILAFGSLISSLLILKEKKKQE